MVLKCHVCQKTSDVFPNVSFHRFPTNPEKRMIWFALLGFREDKELPIRGNICSEHFDVKDIRVMSSGKRYLVPDANPKVLGSLFEPSWYSAESSSGIIHTETIPSANQDIGFDDLIESPKNADDTIVAGPSGLKDSSSTDTADECGDVVSYIPKKRLKKNHLDVETKKLIFLTYKKAVLVNPHLPIDQISKNVSEMIGVCRSTVYRVIREYTINRTFREPRTNQNRTKKKTNLFNDSTRNAIKLKIDQFCSTNVAPSLTQLLNLVNQDPELPNFKRSTFHKILKEHFSFGGHRKKNKLSESTVVENREVHFGSDHLEIKIEENDLQDIEISESSIPGVSSENVDIEKKLENCKQEELDSVGATEYFQLPIKESENLNNIYDNKEEIVDIDFLKKEEPHFNEIPEDISANRDILKDCIKEEVIDLGLLKDGEESQVANSSETTEDMISEERYIEALKPEDFITPEDRSKNVEIIKNIFANQYNRINNLNRSIHRLKYIIVSLEDLLDSTGEEVRNSK